MLIVFGLPELSRSHYLKRVQENQGVLCFEGKAKGKAKLALSGLLGGLWAVSRVVGSAGACLAFRGLSCWGDSWALCLWFRFWAWGVCELWVGGGACGLCLESRVRCECASSSEFCRTGKLQWQFTCGFDFRHGLWFCKRFCSPKRVKLWTFVLIILHLKYS